MINVVHPLRNELSIAQANKKAFGHSARFEGSPLSVAQGEGFLPKRSGAKIKHLRSHAPGMGTRAGSTKRARAERGQSVDPAVTQTAPIVKSAEWECPQRPGARRGVEWPVLTSREFPRLIYVSH